MGTVKVKLSSIQPQFKIYESINLVASQKWRWNVVYLGRIIGASSEGYSNKADCIKNAEKLKEVLNKAF